MSIKKFLKNYAEIESQLKNFPSFRHYSNVLVIPAYKEIDDFLGSLKNLHSGEKFLLVLIINQPEGSPSCAPNSKLEQELQQKHPVVWQDSQQHIALFESRYFDILRVDRFRQGKKIPAKQGVGLARKIGADIACQLIQRKIVDSPWIFSSDADAKLPADYFSSAEQQKAAALIYPHQHIGIDGKALSLAGKLYDRSLNYYVSGLRWAGSPYAFHTIGSCIAINHLHYAKVRGFPKRAGGEDFYLLNKVRKTGSVISLNSSRIELLARESDRVPFGTGPALKKINAFSQPENEYLFYHPWLFHYLQSWLNIIKAIFLLLSAGEKVNKALIKLANKHCEQAPLEASILLETLQALGCEKALLHAIGHSSTEAIFLQHMMNWFDGFKTLKFLHYLRDEHLPSIPLSELEAIDSFYKEGA